MEFKNSVPQPDPALGQTLQQALQQLGFQALQFRCAIRDQTLLILVEHLLHVEPDVEQTFSRLEAVTRDLVPEMLRAEATRLEHLPVQVFLRIAGYQQPYASRQWQLELGPSPTASPVEPVAVPQTQSEADEIKPQLELQADDEVEALAEQTNPADNSIESPQIEPKAEPEAELTQPALTVADPWISLEANWTELSSKQYSTAVDQAEVKVETAEQLDEQANKDIAQVAQDIKLISASQRPELENSEDLEASEVEAAIEPPSSDPNALFESGDTSEPPVFLPAEPHPSQVLDSQTIDFFNLASSAEDSTDSVSEQVLPDAVDSQPDSSLDSLDVDLLIYQLADFQTYEPEKSEPDLLIRELNDFRVPERPSPLTPLELAPDQLLPELHTSAEVNPVGFDHSHPATAHEATESNEHEFNEYELNEASHGEQDRSKDVNDLNSESENSLEYGFENIASENETQTASLADAEIYESNDDPSEIATPETESTEFNAQSYSVALSNIQLTDIQPDAYPDTQSNSDLDTESVETAYEETAYEEQLGSIYYNQLEDHELEHFELNHAEESLQSDSEDNFDRFDTSELLAELSAEDSFSGAVLSESAVLPEDSLELDSLDTSDTALTTDLSAGVPASVSASAAALDLQRIQATAFTTAAVSTASTAASTAASTPASTAVQPHEPNSGPDPALPSQPDQTGSSTHPLSQRAYPNLVLMTALGLFGLTGGLYMLSRPCVIGRCDQIQQAQQLSLAAIQTARTTDSALEVVGAYKQLNEANYLLGTIPPWSSQYAKAQNLLASYEGQSVVLKQVVEALEQANQAARQSQKPPHPMQKWREIQWSWREVIEKLEKVPADSTLYGLVQRKLQEYRANLNDINQRVLVEQQAQERVAAARRVGEMAQSQAEAAKSVENWQETAANWTTAIRQLQQIPSGTIAHSEAQQLLALYQPKFTQASIQQSQEQAAAESYAQALSAAEQARVLEQQNQWTEAAARWRSALNAAQQIPSRSSYYSQVQPLLGTYAKTLEQAQDNAQRAGAIQLAKAGFDQVCAGSPKVCTYTLSPQSIRVQFTSIYDQTVTQLISNASPSVSGKQFPPAAVEQVNGLLRSLADMSEATQVPIELYNSNGSKLGTYRPSLSGYVLQQ